MDESPLIDLAPRTSTLGPGGAASSRVLIFLKGSDVETRGGGLFFEKFDYLQGEVLSSILGFWKGIIRDAWASAVSGVQGILEDVSSSVSGLSSAVAPDVNISAPALQTPFGQMSGAAKWGRTAEEMGAGQAARIRSTRIGSIEVMTREEVVRQGSTRVRAVQRGGKRRARRLLDRLLQRWGLISKKTHELSEFFPDGAWSPTSSKTVHVRTTVMKTAFAQAMRQARDDSASDLAYWRAIMSAFLRPVELQDPIFETAVVLYATSDNKVGGGEEADELQDNFWTQAVISGLRFVDPKLPAVWGFRDSLMADDAEAGGASESIQADGRSMSTATPRDLSFSMVAYKGVKVQNLRTLFPFRQLRFRPLDSFKLDLVTLVTFFSIAATRLRFDDDPLTDLVAISAFSVWSIGVYYRILARRNDYELETTRRLAERISARADNVVRFVVDTVCMNRCMPPRLRACVLVRARTHTGTGTHTLTCRPRVSLPSAGGAAEAGEGEARILRPCRTRSGRAARTRWKLPGCAQCP